jgi:protein-tyrosine phosphatase
MVDIKYTIRRLPISKGTLLFGPAPEMDSLKKLIEMGVSVIWNQIKEMSFFAELEERNFKEVLVADIEDECVPDDINLFASQLDHVCAALRAGHTVFIHCQNGHGRTGMALAAILVQMEGLAPDAAMRMTKSVCSGPAKEAQVEFVRGLARLTKVATA